MTAVRRIHPSDLAPVDAYTQVVTAEPGRMVFVSGQVAWSPESRSVPAALEDQARVVAQNLARALEAADATTDDVVSIRVFVVDLDPEKLEAGFPPLVELFGGRAPAVTGVGVTSLAAPDLLIEVEAIAVV